MSIKLASSSNAMHLKGALEDTSRILALNPNNLNTNRLELIASQSADFVSGSVHEARPYDAYKRRPPRILQFSFSFIAFENGAYTLRTYGRASCTEPEMTRL